MKFRTIVETSPDIIWDITRDGILTYVSPRIFDILGCTPDELIGTSILTLVVPECVNKITHLLQKLGMEEPGLITLDVPVLHRDGHPLMLTIRSYPLKDDDGNRIGFRGVGSEARNPDVSYLQSI